MTKQEYAKFNALRKQAAAFLSKEFADGDGVGKSYEGTWELLVSYPNYYEDETATASPDFYQITLHCYLIGPGRHYDWSGKTWSEALRKCKYDIDRWTR